MLVTPAPPPPSCIAFADVGGCSGFILMSPLALPARVQSDQDKRRAIDYTAALNRAMSRFSFLPQEANRKPAHVAGGGRTVCSVQRSGGGNSGRKPGGQERARKMNQTSTPKWQRTRNSPQRLMGHFLRWLTRFHADPI